MPVSDLEARYFKALEEARQFERRDQIPLISHSGSEERLRFVRIE